MTDGPPPDAQRPPRGRPRRQAGFDDEALLSPEEVARRVDVRGGAAPRAPVERAPVRDRRKPARRPERTGARDSLLLVGLVIVGLVAVRLFLPDGPLTASATANPSGSQAAVATSTPAPTTLVSQTGGLITLPPTAFVPTASPGPITAPPITEPPRPTPTLKPGQTPAPTPRPTKTPTITAGPTPQATAQLTVIMAVINGDGGTTTPSSWTVTATSAGTATPGSFPGSSGTLVTLSAGASYTVTASGPSGYAMSSSANCSSANGGLPVAGASETCTIVVNDIAPRITVYTVVDNTGGGTLAPAAFTVSVSGTHVRPSTSFAGSSAGVPVTVDANTAFTITQSGGSGEYDGSAPSGTCSDGNGLALGSTATCTVTFTYIPPEPTDSPATGLLLPLLAMPLRWRPRWPTNRAG